MPSFTFPEFGNQTLDIVYFQDIKNATELLEGIRSGNIVAAFINPEYV